MARSKEFWDQFRSVFNPLETLVEKRSEEFYCEREHEPFRRMLINFRRNLNEPEITMAYFSGHRGSGKSSLLFRLIEEMKNSYFTVYFDIEHNLDTKTANHIDLLFLLGATIFQAAVQEGYQPNEDNLKALADSVYTISLETKENGKAEINIVELVKNLIVIGASAFGAGKAAEKLAEGLSKAFSLSSGVSEEMARKREIQPQVQNIITNLNLIIADVENLTEQELLVVVDGLDKLEDINQARLIFTETDALSGPVCNLIYTVPMLISNSIWFRKAEEASSLYILPNIKLYDREDSAKLHPLGYTTMHQVADKRLSSPLVNLKEEDIFEAGVLNFLIEKSGGIMRWFIRLVRDSSVEAEILEADKITLEAAGNAINEQLARLGLFLDTPYIKELQEVHNLKRPSGSDKSSELIHGQLIVAYRNASTWFDAHPMLWEELK